MIALNTVVRNEAPRIIDCLTRASAYCDELVVVDQHSDDGTADLARDFGATVIVDLQFGFCEASRPLAAMNTRSPWIMCLDADEHLAPDRIPALADFMVCYPAVKLPTATYVDGVRSDPWLGDHYHPNRQLRFYRRGFATYGMKNHTRIESTLEGTHSASGEPWLLNIKSRAEWEFDDARYRVLSEIGL